MRFSMLISAIVAAGAPWLAAPTNGAPADRIPADGPATLAPPQRSTPPRGTVLAPTVRFGDVTLSTGVRLRFAEQGDGRGEVVIFLHGYSDSWFSFSRVMPLLPAGWHVFALDQRGHGDSDRPASGYAMRDLAADVVAFMDAKGIRTATIVGHSMGGFVAQQVALAAPDRVSRLVVVCSGARIQDISGFDEFRDAIASLPEPVPVQFIEEFQRSTIHQPVPDEFFARVVGESRKLPTSVWKSLMAGMADTPAATALGARGIPTLLFFGDRDQVFQQPAQSALRALLPGAQVKVFAEVGHTPHWEKPAEFAQDLTAFVKSGK